MQGKRRVLKLALPLAIAGAALLCAAAASARGTVSYAMSMTVDGLGTVTSTPAGINCRDGGAPDCAEIYNAGTTVTLTATPDSGATFAGWGGFGGCSGTSPTCTVTMDDNKALTAAFVGGSAGQTLSVGVTGSGTVTGTGINCGNGNTDCSESYASGTTVTLTATPATGATFTGWGGACSGNASTCTVTMTQARSVSATFSGSGTTATLTVTVTGNGQVTGPGIACGNGGTDCTENYAVGTSVTLTATPGGGATFAGWGGSCTGNGNTCQFSMTGPRGVSATFSGSSAQTTLTVTVTGSGRVTGPGINCGLGNTDCSEVFAANTTVTLAETPASGASFLGWGGACSGATSSCTIVMSTSRSLTATFTQGSTQKILTVTVGGSGRVSGPGISCGTSTHDCSDAFNDGTIVTLRATPAAGAVFLGWGGACGGTQVVCQVLMNAPRAVSASFSRPGGGSTGTFSARSLGPPLVLRNAVGWSVSLRFFTNRGASALLRMTLNGRLVNAFTFSPHAGSVLVGPFNVARPGQYRFQLTLNDVNGNTQQLFWNACLGCNGGGNFVQPGVFIRSTGVTAVRTSGGWIVRVHFRAAGPCAANVRMTRGGRLVSSGNFTFGRGPVVVSLPARQSGLHRITMVARNSAGRTFRLAWNVLLS